MKEQNGTRTFSSRAELLEYLEGRLARTLRDSLNEGESTVKAARLKGRAEGINLAIEATRNWVRVSWATPTTDFGWRLKAACERRGWSLNDLARELGVTRSRGSQLIRVERPDLEMVERLARVLSVDRSELDPELKSLAQREDSGESPGVST